MRQSIRNSPTSQWIVKCFDTFLFVFNFMGSIFHFGKVSICSGTRPNFFKVFPMKLEVDGIRHNQSFYYYFFFETFSSFFSPLSDWEIGTRLRGMWQIAHTLSFINFRASFKTWGQGKKKRQKKKLQPLKLDANDRKKNSISYFLNKSKGRDYRPGSSVANWRQLSFD